jgi:hypothetical protein
VTASRVRTTTRTVELDYGSFTLRGAGFDDGEDTTPLLEAVLASPLEVAGTDGQVLLVLSPHQNNFALELTVEVWDEEPPDDVESWQQVVRSSIQVDDDRLLYESPTMEGVWFDVPTGTYAVLVSGRSFVARGWPGSTTPGDVWRVQLWPGDVDTSVETLVTWTDPADAEFTTPEALAEARTRMAQQEADMLTYTKEPGEPRPTGISAGPDGVEHLTADTDSDALGEALRRMLSESRDGPSA